METTETMPPTRSAGCPECAGIVPVTGDVLANEIVPCPECGAELEVTSVEPLTVELAPEVEEDWGE